MIGFYTWEGDAWHFLSEARSNKKQAALVIPTNRITKSNGHAVMGAGLALAASKVYPELPRLYGITLRSGSDILQYRDLILLPTKDHWKDRAKIELITQGFKTLVIHEDLSDLDMLFIPKIGSGLGSLPWQPTRMILEQILLPYATKIYFVE